MRNATWNRLVCAVILELGATALFLWWLSRSGTGLFFGASLLHLSAVGMLCLAAWGIGKKHRAHKQYLLFICALLVLFFPILGCFGLLVLFGVKRLLHRQGLVTGITAQLHGPQLTDLDTVEDLERFKREEATVEPVLEVLAGSDENLKSAAVGLLGAIGDREAVALLNKSLADSSSEVRFLAHANLAKLNDAYNQALKSASREAAAGMHGAWARLGDLLEKYARSGLIDDVLQEDLLDQATTAFVHACEASPQRTDCTIRLGKLYLRRNNLEAAGHAFETVPADDPLEGEALLGRCEIALQRRDFAALSTLRRTLRESRFQFEDPGEALLYQVWSQGAIRQ